jgi:dsRNA-specific ribonuclease
MHAKKVADTLKLKSINLNEILTAIKTPKLSDLDNYENLEVLGDSLLKYIFSAFIFISFDRNEEELTEIRTTFIKNEFLAKILIHNGIHRHVLNKKTTF